MDQIQTGKAIVKSVWINVKHVNSFYSDTKVKLKTLNIKNRKKISDIYNNNFSKLHINKEKQIEFTSDNLATINVLLSEVKEVQQQYKNSYERLMANAQLLNLKLIETREKEIQKLLKNVDIDYKVITKSAPILKSLKVIATQRLQTIFDKWNNFIYNTYQNGIIQNNKLDSFQNLFYNDDGSIKIGSSFDNYVDYTSSMTLTEERVAQQRANASELGLTYCWNSNPMDQITKPKCTLATSAGVISEVDMIDKYGLPPRRICRCDLIFTSKDWKGINSGINDAIRERQKELISELHAAPKMLSFWVAKGGVEVNVDPVKYPERSAGNQMYKKTEDSIKLLEANPVPEYK